MVMLAFAGGQPTTTMRLRLLRSGDHDPDDDDPDPDDDDAEELVLLPRRMGGVFACKALHSAVRHQSLMPRGATKHS